MSNDKQSTKIRVSGNEPVLGAFVLGTVIYDRITQRLKLYWQDGQAGVGISVFDYLYDHVTDKLLQRLATSVGSADRENVKESGAFYFDELKTYGCKRTVIRESTQGFSARVNHNHTQLRNNSHRIDASRGAATPRSVTSETVQIRVNCGVALEPECLVNSLSDALVAHGQASSIRATGNESSLSGVTKVTVLYERNVRTLGLYCEWAGPEGSGTINYRYGNVSDDMIHRVARASFMLGDDAAKRRNSFYFDELIACGSNRTVIKKTELSRSTTALHSTK